MRPVRFAGLLTLLALVAAPAFAEEKVEVKVLKYDALGQLVRDNKGKVIVVDVWEFS
jgi:hypothetical protein